MMPTFLRPMKAASLLSSEVEHTNDEIYKAICSLKYWPKGVTSKEDGIRAERTTDLFSCRMKMIPNESIRIRSMKLPYGFDMELMSPELEYHKVESIVMSEEHPDSEKIKFYLLDWFTEGAYQERIHKAAGKCLTLDASDIITNGLHPHVVSSPRELMDDFLACEESNGEGICFRTMDSPYKQGYSTLNQEWLIKLCRYVRSEVTIVSCYEQMLNTNRSKRNEIGMMARSKTKEGRLGKETLGGFLCRTESGLEFKVATGIGLTESKRQEIWNEQEQWVGKQITIKSKGHGTKIKPRSPVFIGKREEGF